MRANRKMRDQQFDAAEVGIGTMIVFIATVLVAAIAAGVPAATITLTFRARRSATSAGKRSYRPSAHRYSIATF